MTDRGWLCPRCDAVNAPSVLKCTCGPALGETRPMTDPQVAEGNPWIGNRWTRQTRDMLEQQRAHQVANDILADKTRTWQPFSSTCDECLPYKNICTHVRPKTENDQ